MPVTDRKISISDGSNTIEISLPVYPYTTRILMPFDIVALGQKSAIYDHGATYDIRQCECSFVLNATEMGYLRDLLGDSTKGRGTTCTFTMATGSGFFPFGHDKGDVGTFTGTIEIVKDAGLQATPWLYYQCDCLLTNTGSWPAYSIVADRTDQPSGLSIGSITGIRFPQSFFVPDAQYAQSTSILQGHSAKFIDRGVGGDRYTSEFELVMSNAKAANLINHITGTIRATAFNLVSQTNYYPYGLDKGSGTHSSRFLNETFELTNERLNVVYLPLKTEYISGP